MKVGDLVRSAYQTGIFKVIKTTIVITLNSKEQPVRTVTYYAASETNSRSFRFTPRDLFKTVFPVHKNPNSNQISMWDEFNIGLKDYDY